jgi:acetoin utilization deacetylase AcuC-like enzyme
MNARLAQPETLINRSAQQIRCWIGAMATGYSWHELFAWHDTGTFAGESPADPARGLQPYVNYETADTKRRIHELIVVSGLIKHLTRIEPRLATDEELLRVHTPGHVQRIRAASATRLGGDAGDLTTPFGRGGFEIATTAVGAVLEMVDALLTGRIGNGYALVRPPGHHALPDTGMGYCIFANLALGAAHARAVHGVKRIAVIDWDVHHGNGTQAIFDADPDVLTISLHQDGLYPHGTGNRDEIGVGAGRGSVLNVPLPPGCGNGAYVHAMQTVVVPALQRFKPEMIMVASGFDSSAFDPLGRMMLTANGYAAMTTMVMQAADELCGGRVLMTHEGGYNAVYSPICGLAVVQALSGVRLLEDPFAESVEAYPGQALQPHQAEAIEAARLLISGIPA